MASKNSDEEPSSPPIVVGRKILDSPSEIKSKSDYDRVLKVQTRKRSLPTSPVKEKNEEEIKVPEDPSPKKKQKIRHETRSSEELPKIYYCHHVYCDWSASDKAKLNEHHTDLSFHEEHLQNFQLFCETCQTMVTDNKWPDIHNQAVSNMARQKRSEMVLLIQRLKILQEKKLQFKKAEEEFNFRKDENYRPETVAVPGVYKFNSEPTKIELPNGVQEFKFLPKQWEKMDYFNNIHSTELGSNIPINAERIIDQYKAKKYSVENLQLMLQRMTELYEQILNDDVFKQWLLYNICKLKLFMDDNKLKVKPTKTSNTAPINNSPTQISSPLQQQIPMTPMTMPNFNMNMPIDPKFILQNMLVFMQYMSMMAGGMPNFEQMQQQMQQMQQMNPMTMPQFAAPNPYMQPALNNNMQNMFWPQQMMMQQPQMQQMFGSSQSVSPSLSSKKKDKKKKHKK